MLKGVINGIINISSLFITFSTSVLISVRNVWIIVRSYCDLSEHNMERDSCQPQDHTVCNTQDLDICTDSLYNRDTQSSERL